MAALTAPDRALLLAIAPRVVPPAAGLTPETREAMLALNDGTLASRTPAMRRQFRIFLRVLLRELSRKGIQCVGLDAHIREVGEGNKNLTFIQGNAVEPELDSRFNLVFSDQMLEHLHPEDVPRHFVAVKKLLKRNGCYAFSLPSPLIGPADISAHFGCKAAEGLHLKEWLYRELWPLLQQAGFSNARSLLLNPRLTGGMHSYVPIQAKILIEALFKPMPRIVRHFAGKVFMLSIFLVAK